MYLSKGCKKLINIFLISSVNSLESGKFQRLHFLTLLVILHD